MKNPHRKHQQVKTEPAIMRKPLRKVTETKDGGLILDDRDAAEPFLAPTTPRSVAKKVAVCTLSDVQRSRACFAHRFNGA